MIKKILSVFYVVFGVIGMFIFLNYYKTLGGILSHRIAPYFGIFVFLGITGLLIELGLYDWITEIELFSNYKIPIRKIGNIIKFRKSSPN
ncbi:hypothetical protein [Microaceticoccus formicicus]|uniref:hypothetical protein n=1 Tax=Microaceticoccus formicicus TaxID=3118105 RepID=UPI003CD01D27|nr:hypothetical protein VZL98_09055 [Peptoniphilaceae bacterium AMB_02]